MGLPIDLISQFVKATKDTPDTKKETIVYGTTVEHEGVTYVKIDGSELLTPVIATADTKPGERVTVMIKNHTATVTGNITSPAARTGDLKDVNDSLTDNTDKITEFEVALGYKAEVTHLNAAVGRITDLETDTLTVKQNLASATADITKLQSDTITVNKQLNANKANIENLTATKLDASVATMTYATIANLDVTNQNVYNLTATYGDFKNLATNKFTAIEADIKNLEAGGLTVEELEASFANIDFSNIGQAAMEYFYAQSGLIDNVVVSDANITGTLVGVTITGDLIQANTLVADKLVMLGEDGVYYKLNTNGMTLGAEQTDYNSLNGRIITAKSITAEKVSVDDLVAFDATIGGFTISDRAIYSEVKDSSGNTTRGIYFDADGQMNIGDATNFIKYVKDDAGNYHLTISADTILYDINGNQRSIADLGVIGEYVRISTYEGKPCIELGESDSDFKLLITNTEIIFMEGSDVPAYFSNQALHITKAVIEDELKQGEFVWKIRDNGNLGLMWVGGDS